MGELDRRSIGKYEKTVKFLRYKKQIIHVNYIENFFSAQIAIHCSMPIFRCPTCVTFFKMSHHFNRYLICYRDQIKNINPKSVYTLQETLFQNRMGLIFSIPKNKPQSKMSLVLL